MSSLSFSVPRPSLAITSQKIHYKSATLLGMTGEMPIVLLSVWKLESYVRGHNVYKDVWTPTIGEKLLCKMEPDNIKDKYAVCVQKDGVIVGHLMLGKTSMQCVFKKMA